MSRRSSSDELMASGFALVALLTLVALIILAWLACQAIALVVETCAAHPGNRPLRWAVGVALVATLAAGVSGLRFLLLNVLAALALVTLVATAWVVKTYYEELFTRSLTPQRLIGDVLQSPWW